jgi:hypothetical protein
MVTQRRKNVENKTMVEAIERLLSTTRDYMIHMFELENNVARIFQNRLCLIKKTW